MPIVHDDCPVPLHVHRPSRMLFKLFLLKAQTASYVFSFFRTRITTCFSDRVETGPDFVPVIPHVVAHSRRYVAYTNTDQDVIETVLDVDRAWIAAVDNYGYGPEMTRGKYGKACFPLHEHG